MKTAIVIIDASVAFKLIVEEQGSAEAMAWIGRTEFVAPTLIHSEVGNALWKRVQRGELIDDGEIAARLADLPNYVRTVDETPLLPRSLDLAVELGHPVYDCVYLALAEAEEDELLTADKRFFTAARNTRYASKIKVLEP